MILKVVGDESYNSKAITYCGFMASVDQWDAFETKWRKVLSNHCAPYFHFREFADKTFRYGKAKNPYSGWSDKKRDRFLLDLAIVISESAIPLGSTLYSKTDKARDVKPEDLQRLFLAFFGHVQLQLEEHYPDFNDKVLFVFDKPGNKKWHDAALDAHEIAITSDPRLGKLLFDDDQKQIALQAADMHAYSGLQNMEKFVTQGVKQDLRTLDWILSRNRTKSSMMRYSNDAWEFGARAVWAHAKRTKAEWKRAGLAKQYYPALHFPKGL